MKKSKISKKELSLKTVFSHGLSIDEYKKIISLVGRSPNITELGIFSAMWNEHCSYKSSKKWLKDLYSQGDNVICGPGENAGIVAVDKKMALAFKNAVVAGRQSFKSGRIDKILMGNPSSPSKGII